MDAGVLDAIVAAVAPQANDRLVEIGPGLGALTQALLAALPASARPLQVIEIDRDLVAHLQRRFSTTDINIFSSDALNVDFAKFALEQASNAAARRLRIVGNLPYNISSPLLFHLATFVHLITDQHFMLQKEVVERMTAAPGGSAFGRLSVMLQYRYQLEKVIDVPPSAFDPAPKVDSAVIRMTPYSATQPAPHPQADDETVFAQVVTSGFSQRRKVLRNTLKPWLEKTGGDSAGIDLGARAEDVGVAQWVALANRVVAS